MTHKDIYEKFMIEYDKANITSSYPSLTKYEIATILDKAYLALIAQKLTGNNQRKVAFEGDIKAIEDLRPLVVSRKIGNDKSVILHTTNESAYQIPSDMMYYIQSVLCKNNDVSSLDNVKHSIQNIKIVPREVASKFMVTDSNMPWITNPVAFIENDNIYVLYDSYTFKDNNPENIILTFLKKPIKFTEAANVSRESFFILDESKLDSDHKIK